MACYHLHVEQIKRSAGRSVVACAAYRAGEHLYDDYYGEDQDYTRKSGVIYTEIFLPANAPERLRDRETLWNEVEKNCRAQLAHSYDMALQNEFSMEENIALARKFVEEQFVARGMIADLAVHAPDNKGGISNPHIHVLIPIRPLNEDGSWGQKEKKIPLLDQDGIPVIGKDGKVKMTAVSTTGWSSKETLGEIRKAWAEINNEFLEKKGFPQRIDWRSYETQGIDQIPTIHEGPEVRYMERRGIETAVGKLNRMIRATNSVIKHLREMIVWINKRVTMLKEELLRTEEPNLASYLSHYYEERNRVAETYSHGTKKAQRTNLQEHVQAFNFLIEQKIHTPETLQLRIKEMEGKFQPISQALKEKKNELKEVQSLLDKYETWTELGIVHEQYEKKFFGKKRFYQEHEKELKHFFALEKELKEHRSPDGKMPSASWKKKTERLLQDIEALDASKKELMPEYEMLKKVQKAVDGVFAKETAPEDQPKPRAEKKEKLSIHERIKKNKTAPQMQSDSGSKIRKERDVR